MWKVIEDTGRHEINEDGIVRIIENKRVLTQRISTTGYWIVQLWDTEKKKSYMRKIHRLLMIAFIPNPENKEEVNHIDGDKLNYSLDNLEWCTKSENMIHTVNTKLRTYDGILNDKNKSEIIELISKKHRVKDIAKKFGISPSIISARFKNYLVNNSYRHTLEERVYIKTKLFESTNNTKSLAKDLGISERLAGRIRTGKDWTDILIGKKPVERRISTSMYSYEKSLEIKNIILSNKNLSITELLNLVPTSFKTTSKIRRGLIWKDI